MRFHSRELHIKKPLEKRLGEHLVDLSETDRVARDFFGDKAPPRVYNVMRYWRPSSLAPSAYSLSVSPFASSLLLSL